MVRHQPPVTLQAAHTAEVHQLLSPRLLAL